MYKYFSELTHKKIDKILNINDNKLLLSLNEIEYIVDWFGSHRRILLYKYIPECNTLWIGVDFQYTIYNKKYANIFKITHFW